jgi:hypothetical protein
VDRSLALFGPSVVGSLSYVAGLARIGGSLTSTIGSLSIPLTIVFQLVLVWLHVKMILTPDIPLAVTGAIIAVFGIYLIHKVDRC